MPETVPQSATLAVLVAPSTHGTRIHLNVSSAAITASITENMQIKCIVDLREALPTLLNMFDAVYEPLCPFRQHLLNGLTLQEKNLHITIDTTILSVTISLEAYAVSVDVLRKVLLYWNERPLSVTPYGGDSSYSR